MRRRAADLSPDSAVIAGTADTRACSPLLARPAPPRNRPRVPDIGGLGEPHYGRLAALPDQSEPLQRSQLLAALSVGMAHYPPSPYFAAPRWTAELDSALEAFARGNSAMVIAQLRDLEHRLASTPGAGPETRSHFGRAAVSWLSPRRLPSMALTSTRSARMRFTEINLFGVYVAPISLIMVAAWLVTIALRRVADR